MLLAFFTNEGARLLNLSTSNNKKPNEMEIIFQLSEREEKIQTIYEHAIQQSNIAQHIVEELERNIETLSYLVDIAIEETEYALNHNKRNGILYAKNREVVFQITIPKNNAIMASIYDLMLNIDKLFLNIDKLKSTTTITPKNADLIINAVTSNLFKIINSTESNDTDSFIELEYFIEHL